MKTIAVIFNPDLNDDELNHVIQNLRHVCPDEQVTVDENGVIFLTLSNDLELMEEAMCQGILFSELEAEGIENPFFLELVGSDEAIMH